MGRVIVLTGLPLLICWKCGVGATGGAGLPVWHASPLALLRLLISWSWSRLDQSTAHLVGLRGVSFCFFTAERGGVGRLPAQCSSRYLLLGSSCAPLYWRKAW